MTFDADSQFLAKATLVFQILGHPLRMSITSHLAGREMDVSEIAKSVNAKMSNVSRHLAKMQRAGVVQRRKRGLNVYYRLNWPFLSLVLANTRGILQR
jgi:ArsR family transcriptional regulator